MDSAPTRAELARQCSEAAGKGGNVEEGKWLALDQSISCTNSKSLGWTPRAFDAAAAWGEYQAAKAGLAARQAKK